VAERGPDPEGKASEGENRAKQREPSPPRTSARLLDQRLRIV
jgi:hypothetical protein